MYLYSVEFLQLNNSKNRQNGHLSVNNIRWEPEARVVVVVVVGFFLFFFVCVCVCVQ